MGAFALGCAHGVTRLPKLLPAMTSGLIAFDPELQPKGSLPLPMLFLAKVFHHIHSKDTGTVGQIRDWNLKTPFREGHSFNNPTPPILTMLQLRGFLQAHILE